MRRGEGFTDLSHIQPEPPKQEVEKRGEGFSEKSHQSFLERNLPRALYISEKVGILSASGHIITGLYAAYYHDTNKIENAFFHAAINIGLAALSRWSKNNIEEDKK